MHESLICFRTDSGSGSTGCHVQANPIFGQLKSGQAARQMHPEDECVPPPGGDNSDSRTSPPITEAGQRTVHNRLSVTPAIKTGRPGLRAFQTGHHEERDINLHNFAQAVNEDPSWRPGCLRQRERSAICRPRFSASPMGTSSPCLDRQRSVGRWVSRHVGSKSARASSAVAHADSTLGS